MSGVFNHLLSLWVMLQGGLILLRALGGIDWKWAWVLMPIWVGVLLVLIVGVVVFAIAGWQWWMYFRRRRLVVEQRIRNRRMGGVQ